MREFSQPRYLRLLVCIGLVGVAGIAGWVGIRAWTRPSVNLLIITLDTTRADHVGCYRKAEAVTPALDALADRGVLFERAYSTAPLTLPSHASMFTGLYASEHGLRTNGKHRLPPEIPTLAETLRAADYATGAFVASFVLDSRFGLDRGFDTYGDDLTGTEPADEVLHRNRPGDRVVDEALAWLQSRTHQPFFCWVHLYDPHSPYLEHPETFGQRFQGRPYDAEIAFVDIQIARLLQHLEESGLEDRTLVIVVGDHGEGLGEHLERRHGMMLYNSTIQVPLIMSLPGSLPPGRRIAAPVSLVDMFPTVLEALDASGDLATSGLSLMSAANGEELPPRSFYAETDEPFLESGWSPLQSLTTTEWKYIRTPRPELYDIVKDPQETRNLAGELDEQVQLLEIQLAELEHGLQQREGVAVSLSEVDRLSLASLGYVGNPQNTDPITEGANLADIKDMIGHYNALEDARHALEAGQFDEATRRLTELVAAAPGYELAEITLADVSLRQGRFDEAVAAYRLILERNPDCALAHCHLGDAREAQGQIAEAIPHYQQALQQEPDSAKLHYNLARCFARLGRMREAVPGFQTALKLDPGFVFAHIELGSAYVREGRFVEALNCYQEALQYDDKSVLAHMNAAAVLAQLNRSDEAVGHLQRAAKISPSDGEIQFQLGVYFASQNRFTEAVRHLEEALRLQPERAQVRDLLKQIRSR